MNIYRVTFQYSETTYCSNVALADSREAVEAHYSKYTWANIEEGTAADLEEAERKGKPVIECEPVQPERIEDATPEQADDAPAEEIPSDYPTPGELLHISISYTYTWSDTPTEYELNGATEKSAAAIIERHAEDIQQGIYKTLTVTITPERADS